MTALDKTWHPEHFFCTQCGKQFGEDGYHEKDGKPYCRADYFDLFAPKCGGCNTAITDNYISALNSQWHPDCFVCRVSKSSIYWHENIEIGSYRIAVALLLLAASLTTKVSHIVKLTTMLRGDHFALAAINQLLDDASQRCLENSILNILFVHSAWNSWTKERLKNKTTNLIVILVSRNFLVNREQWLLNF